jgi:ATP-binding protein involved in chromosome partitioning
MNNTVNKPSIIAHKVKAGLTRIGNIKNIIAITSGKGGVGKSTTTLNLAIAMSELGAKVGILDADIYGPSLPILVGAKDYKPAVSENNRFVPLDKFGIKSMSFGFLADPKTATIWRGAMVNKALSQLLNDSEWGELDCLFVDMPPGTGDIHLTIAQTTPLTATIVVTTPQDIALLDVGKSINMFQKLDIPCLGVVENMSTHICENCGHESDIFGLGGSSHLKDEYNLDLLAKLPLNLAICQHSDRGTPIALLKESPIASTYAELAKNALSRLSQLPKDYSGALSGLKITTK